jgi:serine/threonine protein phosphatase PrpC
MAVADGHGNAGSFRSGAGAELAVRTAIALLRELAARGPETDIPAVAADWLPRELVARWREAVVGHLASNPFSAADLEIVRARSTAAQSLEAPWQVYGSTVLGVLATATHVVYVQLGDGDILIVSAAGQVSRPWPRDPRLLGVETTSLCGQEARPDTRVMVQAITGDAPTLVLLATDGYANSFREDEGFLRIGADILDIIRQEGMEKVGQSVEGWLSEASECGSGDDITMGILCRAITGEAGDGD